MNDWTSIAEPAISPPTPDEEVLVFPLSYGQQRLWLLDQLSPGDAAYNLHHALRIAGALRPLGLRRALEAVAERHETLRTTFAVVDGQPVQVVADRVAVALPLADL
ncbi:MAG TPA: condensation domain-containing protein, partial [Thermoanaerobaculia bacterium]